MKILVVSLLCVFLLACNVLPFKGGLDILEDIGKIGKIPDPTNMVRLSKVISKTPSLPKVGLSLPRMGLSAPNLKLVKTLPTSVRLLVMRPPRPMRTTQLKGVRPIRVSAPYTLDVQQRQFARLGSSGLARVNAAHPSARAEMMEQVLADLLKTPYILAQPVSIRRSLRRGSLSARWSATYSLYGYPVGVPYYYSDSERRRKKEEREYYRNSEEARNAHIASIQLQLFLESILLNTGLVHVKNDQLFYGNLLVPQVHGHYRIEMIDGPGTAGITGEAVLFLKEKSLSIVGRNGINNIILEPNLIREMNVYVSGNKLNFGGSTLHFKGVENLFIGPSAINVSNIDRIDNAMVESQIRTALTKAGNQPLFKNFD